MVITGMTDAPIPWPIAKNRRGRHSLIVYKDLAKAVRRESNQAVAHWWGVDPQTLTKWRRALGVERATEGDEPSAPRLHERAAGGRGTGQGPEQGRRSGALSQDR